MGPLTRSRLVVRLGVLLLLIGGGLAARVLAQAPGPAPAPASLIETWLKPDTVLSIALVILYAGELRGDVRRLKEDVARLQRHLHDDYMTRETVEARFSGMGRRVDDR